MTHLRKELARERRLEKIAKREAIKAIRGGLYIVAEFNLKAARAAGERRFKMLLEEASE